MRVSYFDFRVSLSFQCMCEFSGRECGGAEFADHDACGRVGEPGSIRNGSARSNRKSQDTEHGIAGSGYVENLATGGATLDTGLADARVSHIQPGGWDVQKARRALLQN